MSRCKVSSLIYRFHTLQRAHKISRISFFITLSHLHQYKINMDVSHEFLCPITSMIMRDPLMTKSGLSFERTAILKWMESYNSQCPVTRQRLTVRHLVPNHALKGKIDAWCCANNVPNDNEDDIKVTLATICVSDCEAVALKNLKSRSSPATAKKHNRFALGLKRLKMQKQ
jgi:hypothetical protein